MKEPKNTMSEFEDCEVYVTPTAFLESLLEEFKQKTGYVFRIENCSIEFDADKKFISIVGSNKLWRYVRSWFYEKLDIKI